MQITKLMPYKLMIDKIKSMIKESNTYENIDVCKKYIYTIGINYGLKSEFKIEVGKLNKLIDLRIKEIHNLCPRCEIGYFINKKCNKGNLKIK